MCTPGMGVNLWGVSPLYVNPVNVLITLTKVLAEGKGGTVRDRLEEAEAQSYEPTCLRARTQTGMNYFGISEYYRPIPEIDHWLRRRVRMCYWKQWRYARTLATQTGMTNQWLKDPCLQQAGRASVCQRAVGEHSLSSYGSIGSLPLAGKCEPPRAPARCRQGPACGVVWGLGG